MKKLHCLFNGTTKFILIQDWGDSSKFAVLHICKPDIFVKTDKRIKSKDDFIHLYGYEAVHTEESINIALNGKLWIKQEEIN